MRCRSPHLSRPRFAMGLLLCQALVLVCVQSNRHCSAQARVGHSIAIIQVRDASFWEQYKWRIVGVTVVVTLQSLLILGLLLERRRQKVAARLLVESEERYRNVVETQTELICRYLPDTTLTFVNDAYCRYFQRDRQQLIGSKFIDLIPAHAHGVTQQHIQSLLETGRPHTNEYEVIRPDGTLGWHQWIDHVTSYNGVIELQGIGRDITERKRAEEALVNSEEFNRRIVESSSDCVKVLDLEGNLIYMSEQGQRLLEVSHIEDLIGASWIDLWSGDERLGARSALERARDTGFGAFRGFGKTLKGHPKWWHTVITPMRNTRGNVERLLAVTRDVTDQELFIKALAQSEERFSKAFRANPQPMWLTTFDEGRFIDVNDSFLRTSGYERDEVIGHSSLELNLYEELDDRANLLLKPLLESGFARNFELKFRSKSGAIKVLLCSAESLELAGQKCVLVASTDISERKILEENLRLSEREFSTLVENSPDVICRLDCDLRCIYVSPALERLTGIPNERLLGKTTREIAMPSYDSKEFEACCREAIESGQLVQKTFEYNDRHYWTRIIPEFSEDGSVESLMAISEDVTDRIHSEQELTQLTVRLFHLQDEERRRIARELHDVTAQNLFAISINLAKLSQLGSMDQGEAGQLIAECQSLGDQSLKEIRTLSYLLHPPLLDQAGLVSALQWYVEGFTRRSGIYIQLYAEPIGRLSSDVEMALFRVVQEALTNVRRHSASETATIRLQNRPGEILLEIKDQGGGLSIAKQDSDSGGLISPGVGIPGMKQRLHQLGGHLDIASNDQGTTVSAVVPIANGVNYGANTSS